ncbi:MAG: ATP synthase subunit I [Blautia sp.]|nr:ATP synthase subunit I [Blautia sp.]
MKGKSSTAEAVKKETRNIAVSEIIGVAIMLFVFFILHMLIPDKVPFDYRVVLAGIAGGGIAVLNFFLMGITVQKVAETEDEQAAVRKMRTSYTYRMLLQGLWAVLSIVLPCFQFAAGLIPLLIPGAAIKARGFRIHSKNPA